MLKAVIYDLDDTMVNSNPLHARAWEGLLKAYGYTFTDIPKHMRSGFIGMRLIDVAKEVTEYLKLDINSDELYRKRIEAFLLLVEKELELMPGLLESLELFKKHHYKLAIASSGAKKYVELVLHKFHMKDYFDSVITGDDVTKGKPNPEAYLVTAKKLGIPPSECLVLEDATKGIQAAKAAGCLCIAIRNPNVPPQTYHDADAVVNSLHEINLDIIERLNVFHNRKGNGI